MFESQQPTTPTVFGDPFPYFHVVVKGEGGSQKVNFFLHVSRDYNNPKAISYRIVLPKEDGLKKLRDRFGLWRKGAKSYDWIKDLGAITLYHETLIDSKRVVRSNDVFEISLRNPLPNETKFFQQVKFDYLKTEYTIQELIDMMNQPKNVKFNNNVKFEQIPIQRVKDFRDEKKEKTRLKMLEFNFNKVLKETMKEFAEAYSNKIVAKFNQLGQDLKFVSSNDKDFFRFDLNGLTIDLQKGVMKIYDPKRTTFLSEDFRTAEEILAYIGTHMPIYLSKKVSNVNKITGVFESRFSELKKKEFMKYDMSKLYYDMMDEAFFKYADTIKQLLEQEGLSVTLTEINPVSNNSTIWLDVSGMKMYMSFKHTNVILSHVNNDDIPPRTKGTYLSIQDFIDDLRKYCPVLFSKKLLNVQSKTSLFD